MILEFRMVCKSTYKKILLLWYFIVSVSEKVTAMFGNQQALSGIKTIPVNSDQFLKMEETKVPVDDKFFHR